MNEEKSKEPMAIQLSRSAALYAAAAGGGVMGKFMDLVAMELERQHKRIAEMEVRMMSQNATSSTTLDAPSAPAAPAQQDEQDEQEGFSMSSANYMTQAKQEALNLAQELDSLAGLQDAHHQNIRAVVIESAAELRRLKSENERLKKCLEYEQHRAERIGTHGPGCYAWGPRHYECAVAKIVQLEAQAQAVPNGWKLVPIEPTGEMHVAAVKTIKRCAGNADFPPRVYRAMLAAAPAAPVRQCVSYY